MIYQATQPVSAASQHAHPVDGTAASTQACGFAAVPASVPEARRFLASHFGHLPLADDARVCLSELVTNSILHSGSARPGGRFTVRLTLTPLTMRVEVDDEGGPWAPGPRPGEERGRGLLIVGRLASNWGATATSTGRTVWFTMPVRP